MARYDVYAIPKGAGWLLDVQTDLLDGLNTRIVVPLMLIGRAPVRGRRLNPTFTIDGAEVAMVTQYLSSVPDKSLREPIANFSKHHTAIIDALDMLFHGF